ADNVITTENGNFNLPGSNIDGSVSLTGVASDGSGIHLNSGSLITADGALTLIGQSDNNTGVLIESLVASDNGLLTIAGNSGSETGVVITDDIFGGGGITLTSNRDINVNTLIADGDITVTTPRFFRAQGNAIERIDVNGSVISQKGGVTITHGGNGVTPFEVGNAEVNGTAAAIVAIENEIQPAQSFLDDEIQGDIAILTGEFEPDPDPDPESRLPDVDDCTADCTTGNGRPELSEDDPGTLLTVDPQLIPGAEGAILRNENNYTDEYLAYLNLGTAEPPKPDLPQLQFELSLIAEETGEPPAIVYVSFVPGDLDGGLNGELGGTGTPISQTKAADDIQPTDVLEIVVVTPDGPPILKTLSVQHTQVFKTVDRFRTNVTNRGRVRTRTYLRAAQELHSWLIDPIEAELANRGITSLAFVMPPGLRSLPVSALHNGEQFLIERYSVGLMPSVSLTDMRYVDVRETEVLAMGASDFEDQPELPAVPIELSTIAEELWPGDFVINETFTPDSLVANRARKPYGIVHLATHAEFVAGQPEESFILLGVGQSRQTD
ncbi:MAG: CHAT domain-containing protein, partial [Cyanobacteria bacterium J06576_12]